MSVIFLKFKPSLYEKLHDFKNNFKKKKKKTKQKEKTKVNKPAKS
jgi:hypothetical protein